MSDNLQKLHDTALMSVELRCRELEADLSAISQFFGQRIPADDFKEAASLQALFTGYVLRLEAALAESRQHLEIACVAAGFTGIVSEEELSKVIDNQDPITGKQREQS